MKSEITALLAAGGAGSLPWYDILLCVLLVALAWRALAARSLSQAVVLFIGFGLAVALAWARLGAVDVALAEAAIGSGLFGVLLIDWLAAFGRAGGGAAGRGRRRGLAACGVMLLLVLLFPVLLVALRAMPAGGGLAGAVDASLDESGVRHPVTAVLLNFRGYDTWLEIGVLLLALPAILVASGRPDFPRARKPDGAGPTDPLVSRLVRLLVPLMVLVCGAVLWLGESRPGGAFQAGVILGAAAVLARLAGFPILDWLAARVWQLPAVAGFAAFLVFGMVAVLLGRSFLEYDPATAGTMIFLIEAACTFSIAFALAAFHALLATDDSGPEDRAARPTQTRTRK